MKERNYLDQKKQNYSIEKNVETGLEKIPRNQKERLLREERTKKTIELKEMKEDMWKLRTKDDEIKKIT